jgi:hypothetical protein
MTNNRRTRRGKRRYRGGKARTRAARRAQAKAQQRNNQVMAINEPTNGILEPNSVNVGVATNEPGNGILEPNSGVVANGPGNGILEPNSGVVANEPGNIIPEPNAIHRVANVANATLPEGWKKEQMTNHPAVVWYEKNGGEQWFAPGAEENDPTMFTNDASLPSGWRKAYHRNNNIDPKLYWYVSPNNQTSWTRPNASNGSLNDPTNLPNTANVPAPATSNVPLAPAAINHLNTREANLSPNIQGQLNRIKQKITNINQTLRSFKQTQTGGTRRR